MSLLNVSHLSVDYGRRDPVHAVRDVSLEVGEDEFVGLVGESGCGKSTLGFSIARLEQSPARIVAGRITIADQEWTGVPERVLSDRRWRDVAIVLQSGMNALNPVITIRSQFDDVMVRHTRSTKEERLRRSEEVLDMVHIPKSTLSLYPHELSGGMKQRVVIAMAFLLQPKLIIMDEPTTALDMVVQREIIENLKELRRKQHFSVVFISHDLGLVLEMCDRVVIMYAGQIVENQASDALLEKSLHPYTEALLKSLPDPRENRTSFFGIKGTPPDLRGTLVGCAFAPRCPKVMPVCKEREPQLQQLATQGHVRCFAVQGEVDDESVDGSSPESD